LSGTSLMGRQFVYRLYKHFVNEIVPAAEGGAYIHITTKDLNSALWYLKGQAATKIQESPNIAQLEENPRLTEKWSWAMWQTERLRRQKEKDRERE